MSTHDADQFQTASSFLTFRLAKLQSRLNAQASGVLKSKAGVSLVEWRLIQVLRMKDNASLTEIADLVQMDKGQLSRAIKAMVAKGLLSSTADPQDQRVQHLHLTERARAISTLMMPTMQARQHLLVSEVSEADLAAFYRVIEKLEKASEIKDIA